MEDTRFTLTYWTEINSATYSGRKLADAAARDLGSWKRSHAMGVRLAGKHSDFEHAIAVARSDTRVDFSTRGFAAGFASYEPASRSALIAACNVWLIAGCDEAARLTRDHALIDAIWAARRDGVL